MSCCEDTGRSLRYIEMQRNNFQWVYGAKHNFWVMIRTCSMSIWNRTILFENVSRDWNYEIHETPRIKSESSYNRCPHAGNTFQLSFEFFLLADYLFWLSFIRLCWNPVKMTYSVQILVISWWVNMLFFTHKKIQTSKIWFTCFNKWHPKNTVPKQRCTATPRFPDIRYRLDVAAWNRWEIGKPPLVIERW